MTIMRMVVMGVSGCGKTSVGEEISLTLAVQFVDGDDLHTEANKAKMGAGIPLDDEDRWPWLDKVGQVLASPQGAVVACSALKKVYRDRIRAAAPDVVFVHLTGTRELLWERMSARQNHFMPVSLLDSQLKILEPLQADEKGVTLDISAPVHQLAAQALKFSAKH
ncbi:MAG: putative gluconokinase [Actinomycetota bacterium]|jgi:carbohydrate kinase (thermoresistant glucokinase family)